LLAVIIPIFNTLSLSFGVLDGLQILMLFYCRQKSRNSFNQLLVVLATFNTIFIAFTIFDYSLARGISYIQSTFPQAYRNAG
jgi:hypothetical protein